METCVNDHVPVSAAWSAHVFDEVLSYSKDRSLVTVKWFSHVVKIDQLKELLIE